MSRIIYTPEYIKDPRNHTRRIYFSCHREDFSLFEQVASDIREIDKNCVIAHLDFSHGLDLDHLNEVYDFHLIVIPITENWFCGDGGVHLEEFKYITEQHKAVLPILFDPSVEGKFNKVTNNLQLLRRNSRDYKERLRRSLGEILFDPELLGSVKKVFTHKMFISYCREDLDHTQELIRCIHADEAGRRIAIWYDKYLPTGKNFEDSIFKELDNCEIFGLTITPSIISRENYAVKWEYPHAQTAGKKIVFFELIEIGRDVIHDHFENSDGYDNIKADKSKAFSTYIRNLLENTKGNQLVPSDRAEVDRLLGHAYLNGLFVEFDYDYALKKFKLAADNGDIKAANQLGNMYYRGIGVPRDVNLSIYWYKKAVKLAKKKYDRIFDTLKKIKKLPLCAKANDPMFSMFENTDSFAVNSYNTMLEMLKKFDDVPLIQIEMATRQYKDPIKKALGLLGIVMGIYRQAAKDVLMRANHCASIMRDEGFFTDAREYYQTALEIIDQADGNVSRAGIGDNYRSRIENELNMLMMLQGEADLSSLKATWENSIRQNLEDEELCLAAVKSGHNYGFGLMLAGQLDQARKVFEHGLNIIRTCEPNSGIDEIEILLHRDMGRSYLMEETEIDEEGIHNSDEALKWLKSELWLLENFEIDMDNNPYFYIKFPWNSIYTGDAYFYRGDYSTAWRMYASSIEQIEKYEKMLEDKLYTADFAICIIQIYSVLFSRLSDYSVDEPGLIRLLADKIRAVLEKYGKLKYKGHHRKMADTFLGSLNSALSRLSAKKEI